RPLLRSPSFPHDPAPPETYTLSLHDALPISAEAALVGQAGDPHDHPVRVPAVGEETQGRGLPAQLVLGVVQVGEVLDLGHRQQRSEEHTSELQSRENLVCRLLLEKKKDNKQG